MLRNYIDLPRPIHLLCLGMFINRAGTFVVPFLTIYMRDVFHVRDAFAPLAMGVFGLGAVCGSVIGGHLADRVGRRPVMLAAVCGAAAMLLVLSQLTTPVAFLVGVFLFAAIGDMYRPAASAMIADLTPPLQRAHAFSLMYVAVNLGFAIGPAVGGKIAEYSFGWLFVGDAATNALYALIILFGIRETLGRLGPTGVASGDPSLSSRSQTPPLTPPSQGGRAGRSPDSHSQTPPPAPPLQGGRESPPQVSFADAVAHMLGNTTFLTLCGAAFCIAVLFMQSMSTLPLYLDALGFSPAQYGRIISVNGLLIVLGQLPLTHWMQGKPRGNLLVAAALLTALGFGLKSVAFNEFTFICTVVIWTLGEMIQFPHLSPIITEIAPEHMRARYMGVFGMSFSSANMLGAPLGGLVLHFAGGTVLWLGGAALALLAAALYGTIRDRVAQPPGPIPPAG